MLPQLLVTLLLLTAHSVDASSRKIPAVGSLHFKRQLMGQKHHFRNATDDETLGALRIKRAQVDPRAARPDKTRAKRAGPSTVPPPVVYNGKQPDTKACTDGGGSDSCTDPYYTTTADGVTLANGATFPAYGHVNFQYISCSDYRGEGSRLNQPSYWNVKSGGLNLDPNK